MHHIQNQPLAQQPAATGSPIRGNSRLHTITVDAKHVCAHAQPHLRDRILIMWIITRWKCPQIETLKLKVLSNNVYCTTKVTV